MIDSTEYYEAIQKLSLGMKQLVPDGNNCSICGDDGHQAWECHHNPLVLMKQAEGYKCFHCGQLFFGEAARRHFGNIPSATPRCFLCPDKCLSGAIRRKKMHTDNGDVIQDLVPLVKGKPYIPGAEEYVIQDNHSLSDIIKFCVESVNGNKEEIQYILDMLEIENE